MDAHGMETQKVLRQATATFALIAGAISVASAFAYLIAYKYLTAYFYALGCEWAIDLYPPTQIVQTAAPVAVVVVGLAFTIWNAYPAVIQLEPKAKTIAFYFVSAAICYGIHLLIEKFIPGYRSYFIWAAIVLGSIGAFVAITKGIGRVFVIQGPRLGTLLFVIVTAYGLFIFSSDRGRSHGNETLAHENNRGPRVFVKGTTTPFRLARIVPYERALVFSEPKDGRRTYRVVAVSELTINSAR